MKPEFGRADKAASKTLDAARTLIARLDPDEISLGPGQCSELIQFIEAFCKELEGRKTRLVDADSDLDLQILVTRQLELEEAVRFLDRSFVVPRKSGLNVQILEAADWMCVEGFQMFVAEDEKHPVGPIVAIDAARSPAVWAADASLPIPTLFRTRPETFDRTEKLGEFPLICLPQHIARTPEYLPLLSHEVGHAIDSVLELSEQIRSRMAGVPHESYWDAWMREIVADSLGIALSGEAFGVALRNFLNLQLPFDELAAEHAYPPFELRLKFIAVQLNLLSNNELQEDWNLDSTPLTKLSDIAVELFDQFKENVVGHIDSLIFQRAKNWNDDNRNAWKLSQHLTENCENANIPDGIPFRLLPSAICMSRFSESPTNEFNTHQAFRTLHGVASARTDKPGWVRGKNHWVFSEEYLPALRPTLLCNIHNFKVPPTLLLTSHQKIVFVGATNWQLDNKNLLGEAFELRDRKPWEQIHLFFASSELLKHVEYGERESNKFNDRKLAIEELGKKLENLGWAKRWTLHQFDGPPVFASYWDWDGPGGRIHISPALLGTAIGRCPGNDLVWNGAMPTEAYGKYVVHLNNLFSTATLLAES